MAATTRFSPLARWRWYSSVRSRSSPTGRGRPMSGLGVLRASHPAKLVSQLLRDEAGVVSPNATFGKLRTSGRIILYPWRLRLLVQPRNISCIVPYKVVACNYEVGERRAPAKTQ